MKGSSWGMFPILAPLAAIGLLVTALGNLAGSYNWPYAMLIFWAGILTMALPVFWRLFQKDVSRREALALVILLGGMFYLVSVLRSPAHDIYYDEFLHWRTADDIRQTHHLFTYNPLLPVSSYYPGLEIITTSLVQLTGLDIFQAGIAVIFTARLIMTTALFLILEKLSQSVRVAGLGAAIYMGSSTFVFFDAQFAYESLSVPLAVLTLWFILQRQEAARQDARAWSVVAALCALLVVATHHTSSYILVAILALWTGMAIYQNRRGRTPRQFVPFRITAILLIAILLWLLAVASITVGYLAPHLEGALITIIGLVMGRGGDRPVLSVVQDPSLLSERIVGLVSVGFLLLCLLMGWTAIRGISRKKPLNALAATLVLISLGYLAIPVLRLNSSTWEISNRLASFVFLGVAFVVGMGLVKNRLNRPLVRVRRSLFLPAIGFIICGGIIAGSHPATRLAGPYLVEADARSVDLQGIQAAAWARTFLGTNNRMVADRVQSMLMGSFGRQQMVFRYTDGINISPIFTTPTLGVDELQDIQKAKIRYVLVDHRISNGVPLYGYYFESWEQMVVPSFHIPIQADILQKFDRMLNVSRIYDSGDITIYDLGGLSRGP